MALAASSPDLTDLARPLGSAGAHPEDLSDRNLQRSDGACRIVLGGSETGTRIMDIFQRAPLRIMFPSLRHGTVEELVLVNTGGGIAGGDRLRTSVTTLANASVAVTSQAAERIYRALSEPARIATKLVACRASKLAWLPQETIFFNGGRLSRNTDIELSSGAELLALEWLVLGRAAHREEIFGGYIADNWRVKKDGRLIWADSFRATEEVFSQLRRKALASYCKALGTLIYFGPHLDRCLQYLRATAPSLACHCAATSVGGLVVVRFAAALAADLRLALRNYLQQLSLELGPGPFRVPKMWSC